MVSTNVKAKNDLATHEGAQAVKITPEQALRRSVMSCLLFEGTFYESGEEIGARIARLVSEVPAEKVANIAIQARMAGNLRHVPLLLARLLAKTTKGKLVADTINGVVLRADEMAEFLALYWKEKRQPLSAQVKRGLARALGKFSEYNLAKYDQDNAIKIRDVIRLVHPKPKDAEQAALWKRAIDRTLATPDTWEVALSGGADKKETFTRLIQEGKLGYFALLRNLRNMVNADVDLNIVREAILARKGGAERILPFRYIAAARAAPQLEDALDVAMSAAINDLPLLKGRTIVLVDTSGSMTGRLSGKSDMDGKDAAAALASIVNAESLRVFVFADTVKEIPARRGMAGVDAIQQNPVGGGTQLGGALNRVLKEPHDRLIVITDEQTSDRVPDPVAKGRSYVINIRPYQNGVGYGPWVHIDGFSEQVLRFIHEYESESAKDASPPLTGFDWA